MKMFLGIGSNIGDREMYLKDAVQSIDKLQDTAVLEYSSIYKTEAWGNKDLDFFLNQVILVDTELDCMKFLSECKRIEKKYGRQNDGGWKARTLDIDILLFGNLIVKKKKLQIPHAYLNERMFFLKPLAEIAPEMVIPDTGKTVMETMKKCRDKCRVEHYK